MILGVAVTAATALAVVAFSFPTVRGTTVEPGSALKSN
jgi:hypothetical protein